MAGRLAVSVIERFLMKAAILVSQNNETAAMFVSQTNPLGVELLSYANTFFCSNKNLHRAWPPRE